MLYIIGKAYDITYVRLKFQSPRPADFAIYKKNRPNPADPDLEDENSRPWIPWQYYSLTCRDQYNAEIRTCKLPIKICYISEDLSNITITLY